MRSIALLYTDSNPVRLTTKINDLAEIIYKPLKLWVPNGFQNTLPQLQHQKVHIGYLNLPAICAESAEPRPYEVLAAGRAQRFL